MNPMNYLCCLDVLISRWRRKNRIPREAKNQERWEFGFPDSISGTVLIDGIRVYNKYMEMSPTDLELHPSVRHLNRGAQNKEEWEEWMELRTLLEWSGTL